MSEITGKWNFRPQKLRNLTKIGKNRQRGAAAYHLKVSQGFLFGEVYTEDPWAAAPNSTTANNHLLNKWHAQYKKKYHNKTLFRKM